MKTNSNKLSGKELEEAIRSNAHLTMKELSALLCESRIRVNNCIYNHGISVKRCKGTEEEVAKRVKFVKSHAHWTRKRIAIALNLTPSTLGKMCKKYELKTVRSRFDITDADFDRMRLFIIAHPDWRRSEFVRHFSVCSSTIGRLCYRSRITHSGMKNHKNISFLKKVSVKKISKPSSLINNFLMGDYKNASSAKEI